MDKTAAFLPLAAVAVASSLLLAGLAGGALASEHGDRLAVLETDLGTIVIEFFPDDAPNHVDNFIGLVESGFYDRTLFHRIMPTFMIQGGDPNTIDGDPSTWGQGGPESTVDAEFNQIKHNRGIVSMARSMDPNSAGSQFFIVHQNANFLDGQYTVFGRVVTEQSLQTLDNIAAVPTTGDAGGNKPIDIEQVRITSAVMVDRDDVPDLMNLPAPERMDSSAAPQLPPMDTQSFDGKEYGIALDFPVGWILQQPEKTGEHTPDAVAIGPKTGMMHPAIVLIIKDTDQKTLDEIVAERDEMLKPSIESKGLRIISQERTTINEMPASVINAEQVSTFEGGELVIQFKEIIFYDAQKYYTLAYSNGADSFDAQLPAYEQTVASFGLLPQDGDSDSAGQETKAGGEEEGEEGGDCMIATAAYGSEMAPQVQQLREVRDNSVLPTGSGSAFMAGAHQLYYSFSPVMADMQRENPLFKEAVRVAITPMLSTLSVLNYADIDSEQDMLSYGIGLILLNIGMYVAAPAAIIYKVAQRISSKKAG